MNDLMAAFASNPRYAPDGLEAEIEKEELTNARRVDSEAVAVAELEPVKSDNIDMHEKILGVIDTATRIPRDFVGGTMRALDNTMALVVGRENLDDANDWIRKEMPGFTSLTDQFSQAVAPNGAASQVTQDLSQFAIPFGAYMKGLKAMSAVAGVEAGSFTTAFIADVVTSGTALDPHVERLSSLAKEMGVDNKVIGWLADNENETDSEGRLKNILENAGLGVGLAAAFTSVVMPLKGMWRLSKAPVKTKKAAKNRKPTEDIKQNEGGDVPQDTPKEDITGQIESLLKAAEAL